MTITLPIYYTQEFKTKDPKTHLVGMNAYRNWHYHLSNKVKQHYHDLVHEQAANLTSIFEHFTLDIKVFYKNSSMDGSNVAALMEKFSLDALQSCGVIPQDNVKHHLGTTWSVDSQDRDNPRCEITIKELHEN